MQKQTLQNAKRKFIKYSFSIGVVALALLVTGAYYTAAQQNNNSNGQSLGNHHSEFVLTADPGELVYIPIPKQNFPVNVQITQMGNASGVGQITSFTVASTSSGPIATVPVNMSDPAGATGSLMEWGHCTDELDLGAEKLFNLGGLPGSNSCSQPVSDGAPSDVYVLGITKKEVNVSDRIMFGILKPSHPDITDTFYVQMWY